MVAAGRDMTPNEAAWWRSFKRVLGKMPGTIELNARVGGEIGIAPAGARAANFGRRGDADNFGDDEWDRVRVARLDGRDSHL